MSFRTMTRTGPLGLAFRRAAGSAAPDLPGPELEAVLERSVGAARQARPELEVSPEELAAYAGERIRRGATAEQIEALQWDDLLFSCSCARGDRAALASFEKLVAATARQAAQPYSLPDFASELRQEIWCRLLVGTGGKDRPRLLDYAGRGSLQSWLRVVAARVAHNLARGRAPTLDAGKALEERPAAVDLELQYVRLQYREQFVSCFREAFASLEPRARTVLRWHLVDGVGLEAIARYYRVNRSSVTRWITRARGQLVEITGALLEQRAGLGRSELDGLVRDLKSKLEVSISQLIPASEGPPGLLLQKS